MVIPEPDPGTRSVLDRRGEGTLIFDFNRPGSPQTDMVCGNCGAPLVHGMAVSQVANLVLRCNRCGKYNETLISY